MSADVYTIERVHERRCARAARAERRTAAIDCSLDINRNLEVLLARVLTDREVRATVIASLKEQAAQLEKARATDER